MNKEAFSIGFIEKVGFTTGDRILAETKSWLENRQNKNNVKNQNKSAVHKEPTRSEAYTEFLNSFGPPSLKNPEFTWYTAQPSEVPQIHDIAKIYAKQKLTNQGLTPENFAAFVVTQGSNFANKWNKKNNLSYKDNGMNEEMHKYRDLRHFTPAQWAEFKTYLNKRKY